jgi:hypothetical protein
MVPLLEYYPVTGVLLTGALLFAVFFAGARSPNPLTIFMVAACTFIPVAGVLAQPLAIQLSASVGAGLGIAVVVGILSHALFPDPPPPAGAAAARPAISAEAASWSALRATLVVVPVFVLALTNPAFYLPALIKTALLGQQASATDAHSGGKELVGSTLMGALLGMLVWFGLTMRPNLWMLMLWTVAAALWAGVRIFRVKPSFAPPSFWVNALATMFIVLGPGIEDAAVGKDVYLASAIRCSLFVAVALYAWALVWALESWRASRSRSLAPERSGAP